jgi:hypothetical protein
MPKSRLTFEAATEDEVRLALALLCGVRGRDRNGLSEFSFLSGDTIPTEDQARAALSKLLLSGSAPPVILWALAAVFAPDGQSPLAQCNQQKAILQKINQGHSNPDRDHEIAYWVDDLRRQRLSYEDAVKRVATAIRRSDDQVKKICGRVTLGFDPPPRAPRKASRL